MLILSARVICAISIDSRCRTGSDWLSHGQEVVPAVVRAVAAAWAAVPVGAASAASGSVTAAAAVTAIRHIPRFQRPERFPAPANDFTTASITAQQSRHVEVKPGTGKATIAIGIKKG